MAIHFTCPACKKSVRASDECAGLNGPCPTCKAHIQIPRIATVIPEEKQPGNGNGNGNGHADVPEVIAKTASGKDLKPADKKPDPAPAVPAAIGFVSPTAPAPAPPPVPPLPPAAQYLKFKCPNCEKLIGFPASQAGTPAVCPKCLTRIMIPEKDGDESFIVGALAAAHKNLPTPRQAVLPVMRIHPIRRTAQRLRVAVKTMPWWHTALISVGCLAALILSAVIIYSEFSKEWAARELARNQQLDQDTSQQHALHNSSPPASRAQTPAEETPAPGGPATAHPPGAAEPLLIDTRDGKPVAKEPFDPTKLFRLEPNAPSSKGSEEEDAVAAQQPAVAPIPPAPASSSPLPPAEAKKTEEKATAEEPVDPVLNLIDQAGEKKEQPPAPAPPEIAPEIVGPAAFKPLDNAAPVDPPTVCPDCQGTTFLPLPSYRAYVWDYKEAAPDALAAVPYVPCPKCQPQADPKALVAREAERMRTATTRTNEWTKKLNARMECGETRYVSVASQLSPASTRNVLQQLDKLTQFLQTNFHSALLTQTRPDTHELIVVWDRTTYERLIDLMAVENPAQDWDLTRRASGSISKERCFFNAQRGLSTPPEHMALFQFAHMLILEGTDAKSPDWLTEGFASFCENTLLKKNLCYAFRYELNQVRLAPNWNGEIARYARAGQLQPWDRIFKLDLIGMKALDYLTCYSMVRFLSSDPARFNTLLVDIRAGVDSKRAVEHAYGRSVDDLQKMWAQWALRQR